ncbi:FecCD family ABC transporter permease [Paenibacillus sp. GCM10023252]|uniref:FecCD family ABC transporter permease n=1 Tax=Paenibacillus sp. GCM10023252 TaxID=3252649 RepID=UPI0036113181
MNSTAAAPADSPSSRPLMVTLLLVIGIPCIILLTLLSIAQGNLNLPISQSWELMWSAKTTEANSILVHDTRMPRAIAAVLIGSMLAVAGAIMQGLTRNPLADPTIFGVSQGATFAVALGLALVPSITTTGLSLFSLAGAALGVGLVFLVGAFSRGGLSPAKLALAGTAIGMLLSSFATIVSLQFNVAKDLTFWYAGGLVGMDWEIITFVAPLGVAGLVLAIALSKGITTISFGEDVAVGLGSKLGVTKVLGNLAVLLLTGSAVSMAGYVGFVGLIVPHLTRYLVGSDYRVIIPCSAVLGAILLLLADMLGRIISPPFEVPVSVVTTLIGVPFFVYLASRERRTSL